MFASLRQSSAALGGRLLLLTATMVAIAALIATLFVPVAWAADWSLDTMRRDLIDAPEVDEAESPPSNSFVYAADGAPIAELTFEENRVPISIEDLPDHVIAAVLATEDAGYYEHEGVNHLAIVRALIANVRGGGVEQGGSTITQQYVKLEYLDGTQSVERKVREALWAVQVDNRLTKDQVLERYLNLAYFGKGAYGIGTAAQRYFSKDVADLSVGEAALLAGLLRAPNANNPIDAPQNALARRNIVVGQMAHHRFISDEAAEAARAEELVVSPSLPPQPDQAMWVEWVSRLLTNEAVADGLGTQRAALEAMGGDFEERRRAVFQGGLRIHTTLDLDMQRQAEAALERHLAGADASRSEVARAPAGALVSVAPETGAIVAAASGPRGWGACDEDGSWVGEDQAGRLLCDRTTVNPVMPVQGSLMARRQSGSSFKPFVSAAALEAGIPSSRVIDSRGPQTITGCAEPWTVRNSGGDAVLDMAQAMASSSNVYHARLVERTGPGALVDVAQRLGVTDSTLGPYCPLALGAAAVTPLEMAAAYATLANRGVRCAPHAITRIENQRGEVLWEHDPSCEAVVDPAVADEVNDLLAGPVSDSGTAPDAHLPDHPTRGKTGTTNDNTDAWFVGHIRQLATAAWVGFPGGTTQFASVEQARAACGNSELEVAACPESRRLRNVTVAGTRYAQVFGGTIPAPMWTDYMTRVADRFEPENFARPGRQARTRVPQITSAGSITTARLEARAAGFRTDVEEVTSWEPAGTIVGQSPAAGSTATAGSRLTIRVSDGNQEPPEVPTVVGRSESAAASALRSAGFDVAVRYQPAEGDEVGQVVAQAPEGGVPFAGDPVVIVVGIDD